MAAEPFDPVAWAKDLGDSVAKGGEVKKALDEVASALAKLKKDGDPNAYFKGMEKIAKSAVPNEKKKADKDAQKDLDELKKAAEAGRKDAEAMLFKVAKEDKGKPA